MISPQDLKKKGFSKGFTGYATAEVDEYIAYLMSKYNEAYNENLELNQKLSLANEQLSVAKSEETAISATIVNAQKMADAIVADAKEKASKYIADAAENADKVNSSVSESCDRILAAYLTKITAERDKLQKMEQAVAQFKESLYSAYKEHISLIDNIMPDEEPTPYISDEELEEKAVELARESMGMNQRQPSTEEPQDNEDTQADE